MITEVIFSEAECGNLLHKTSFVRVRLNHTSGGRVSQFSIILTDFENLSAKGLVSFRQVQDNVNEYAEPEPSQLQQWILGKLEGDEFKLVQTTDGWVLEAHVELEGGAVQLPIRLAPRGCLSPLSGEEAAAVKRELGEELFRRHRKAVASCEALAREAAETEARLKEQLRLLEREVEALRGSSSQTPPPPPGRGLAVTPESLAGRFEEVRDRPEGESDAGGTAKIPTSARQLEKAEGKLGDPDEDTLTPLVVRRQARKDRPNSNLGTIW
eukprot:CAMPEP_0177615264 /NCGR_PEP_ID=MMETSP0419_2-20121207/23315_1 /TAXON_ID=582737 /ORGANISM="Tetraselmis sp., Strain GSL018" /LENGTH=268 /DNA_ID=CAMNT_0019112815 /DNA_START=461 /DNA_END=1264 /DNA_ORIENTATION=+